MSVRRTLSSISEQCTLLEPNNFIPSWEAGDEEKKEVSNALKSLRQRYDQIRKDVIDKERAYTQLQVSFQIHFTMHFDA